MSFNTDGVTMGVVNNEVVGKYKASIPLNINNNA